MRHCDIQAIAYPILGYDIDFEYFKSFIPTYKNLG